MGDMRSSSANTALSRLCARTHAYYSGVQQNQGAKYVFGIDVYLIQQHRNVSVRGRIGVHTSILRGSF